MTGTSAPRTRKLTLPGLGALFVVSFSASWFWLNSHADRLSLSRPARHEQRALVNAAAHPTAAKMEQSASLLQGDPPSAPATSEPLSADLLAALIEAGIAADDSEQRSLAIEELSRAPVEQSLAGLGRILRENRDTRSRKSALEALMRLPESPLVREQRRQLLNLLSIDADANMAEAAQLAAGAASG